MADIKLIIGNKNYSSWSLRAWWLLKKAGIDFEEIRIPLSTERTKEQILQYSPAGKVPIYIESDRVIWDSLAIAEYLAEKKPGLWPDDERMRAQARSVSAEMHAGFTALRTALPMNCRASGRKVDLTAAVRSDIQRIGDIWSDSLDRVFKSEGWLFGAFSIADAMYAPVVFRFLTYGVDIGSNQLRRYMQQVQDDAFLRQWQTDAANEVEIIDAEEVG